jgi:hypothetical protein
MVVPSNCTVCLRCGKDPRDHCPTNELAFDDHISLCTLDGIQATRHNILQNVIRQEALKRGQPSMLATVVNDGKPALITDLLFPCIPGRLGAVALTIDISIASPMARISEIDPQVPLSPSAVREAEKIAKYEPACKIKNLDFRPVVFEATGAWGQSARDFFAILLANSCKVFNDTSTKSEFSKLLSLIAVSLHRSIGEKFVAASQRHYGLEVRSITRAGRALLPTPA